MGSSVFVAALTAAFGVILVDTTGFLGALLQSDPTIGDSKTLAYVVQILSVLLTAVAMYVAAIVTANTFSTIVAGRTRRIALLRLIGASARAQRTEVAGQGLAVGIIGAILGLIGGVLLSWAGIAIGSSFFAHAPVGFSPLQPTVLIPAVGVALTTWLAAWAGPAGCSR